MIVPPEEMLLFFSIGLFLTNSDVTNRKQQIDLILSIVRKRAISTRNKSMETTINTNFKIPITLFKIMKTWYSSGLEHASNLSRCSIRPKSEPGSPPLSYISRAAPSVEAHHCSFGPDTGRNYRRKADNKKYLNPEKMMSTSAQCAQHLLAG